LDLGVALGGPVLEDEAFWNGVQTHRMDPGGPWPGSTLAVVLPAWVENQPRRLLNAVAAGIPVVASEECGLAGVPGVIEVPAGDVEALRACLEGILQKQNARA